MFGPKSAGTRPKKPEETCAGLSVSIHPIRAISRKTREIVPRDPSEKIHAENLNAAPIHPVIRAQTHSMPL